MDLLHLRYVVEIARTQSISQAAENLYMGQPNLSRAIKELEDELEIKIFKRTSHGVSVTAEGEEFLKYARSIVQKTDEIESIYKNKKQPRKRISICGPRASYISEAFTHFAQSNSGDYSIEFFYKETNSMKAIQKVTGGDYNLAIVRYQTYFDKYFKELFEEKKLNCETVVEFSYLATLSSRHPLAAKEKLLVQDLETCTEILHADPYVPSLPVTDVLKAEETARVSKKIYVFERATQFSLLETLPDAFMWTSAIPQEILQKYNLIQRECEDNKKIYKDVLLSRKGYRLSALDSNFITELCNAKRACF